MPRRGAPVIDMKADWWRVTCEYCTWSKNDLDTRDEAVELGRQHAHNQHPDEWSFRVQGFKARTTAGT